MSLGLPNEDMEIFNATQDAIEKLLPSAIDDLCRKIKGSICADYSCMGSCYGTCGGDCEGSGPV
jgi:hypothetical protein